MEVQNSVGQQFRITKPMEGQNSELLDWQKVRYID